MKTDEALSKIVRQVKDGNNDMFAKLYEESYRYLHTCAIHIVKNEETAQDVLQDAYTEIFKNIHQLNREEDFLSWASTITNRKCFAYIKKDKDILVDEQVDDEGNENNYFEQIADDVAFVPENILDEREKINIIREIIDNLSDVQRACVIGVYYNEQKQEDIARELGIPVNTVKSHLSRAKAKLKEEIDTTEKKQGIKLYSFAPFMLLLLGKEADIFQEENVVASMSPALSKTIYELSGKSMSAGMVKAVGLGIKSKILIGVAAVLAVGGVTLGVIGIKNATSDNTKNESVSSTLEGTELSDSTSADDSIEASTTSEQKSEASLEENSEEQTEVAGLSKAPFENGVIMYAGNGYVIFYDDNDEAGMYDYEGNLLFSLNDYSYAVCNPNRNGYSVFSSDNEEVWEYYVLDKTGTVVFTLNEEMASGMSDDFLLAINGYGSVLYSLKDGSEFFSAEDWVDLGGHSHPSGLTCFSEGYAFANIYGELVKIDTKGNQQRLLQKKESAVEEFATPDDAQCWVNSKGEDTVLDMMIPSGALCEGYFTAYDGKDNKIDYLISADGSEVYTIDEREILADLVKEKGWDETEELYEYTCINTFTIDGVNVGNVGEYVNFIIWTGNDEDENWQGIYNAKTREILFDEEIVYLSKNAIWTKEIYDENYCVFEVDYLDRDGNVLAKYSGGSSFHNGKAMVLDGDKAYFVNENFEKISTETKGTYISYIDELVEVHDDESNTIKYYWY